MKTLTEIANKYHCDKGTMAYEAHGYTQEYEKLIPSEGKFDLLEIGYYHGDSARMWNEYNPELNMVFMDIDLRCLDYWEETYRYSLYIGDASTYTAVEDMMETEQFNQFDYIIDDGSHNCDDIISSFHILYPKLKKGGFYFIEDLHAPQAKINRVLNYMSDNGITCRLECKEKLLIIQK